MSKELKKVVIVKSIQYCTYAISVTAVLLRDFSLSSWPIYLVLIGIQLTNALPLKYRSNFSSTDPGAFLKKHTRHFENIIDMTITCSALFLVVFIHILKNT
ncbi:hypothetical protein JZO70_07840 [Enterococcus sp. 669A]|uniref:Uncharacterized protein n=1 Tax=Candidatus Enterococcus moelleringii TaxID=2815325 RepID=A0ABS3L8W0_9ENTE|nr:hypothetical protein [Enterococcus sp. 669A]MBO1306068.1 hypothetical protein [Enterococcus sp. 669A]